MPPKTSLIAAKGHRRVREVREYGGIKVCVCVLEQHIIIYN